MVTNPPKHCYNSIQIQEKQHASGIRTRRRQFIPRNVFDILKLEGLHSLRMDNYN